MSSSAEDKIIYKFNELHGHGVIPVENRTVAIQIKTFRDKVVISEKPLQPGEIFLIEIEEMVTGRGCHITFQDLKVGFTQVHPEDRLNPYRTDDELKTKRREFYEFFRTKGDNRFRGVSFPSNQQCDWKINGTTEGLKISDKYIKTCRGKYLRSVFKNSNYVENPEKHQCENLNVGCKIGVFYLFYKEEVHCYLIVNGKIYGPNVSIVDIKKPFYFAAELGERFQQIRILQIHPVSPASLKNLCRYKIRETYKLYELYFVLPIQMMEFLQYGSQLIEYRRKRTIYWYILAFFLQ